MYSVFVLEKETNKWRIYCRNWSIDLAFENACEAVLHTDKYSGLEIEDPQGFVIWTSTGFRQGEGKKLPDPDRVRDINKQEKQEELTQKTVASDGSC